MNSRLSPPEVLTMRKGRCHCLGNGACRSGSERCANGQAVRPRIAGLPDPRLPGPDGRCVALKPMRLSEKYEPAQ